MIRRLRGERGSSAAFVAVLAVPLLLLFGLLLDGGRALEAKLQAKDAAAEAARAAANACDPVVLRGGDPTGLGGTQQPDCQITAFMQPQACQLASDSIQRNSRAGTQMLSCQTSPDGHVVTIGLTFQIRTTFLGLAMRTITVRATQSARTYTSR